MLLYHPASPDYPFPSQQKDDASLLQEAPPISEESACPLQLTEVVEHAELRAYMIAHSLRGNKLTKHRQPFVGELTPLVSPEEKDIIFKIKRFTNKEVMMYRDKNSQVRYIYEEGSEKMVTEKDYPAGTMQVDVVELGLASWNMTNSQDELIPLTREHIIGYLMPEELEAIHQKILEVNPILLGEKARKNS